MATANIHLTEIQRQQLLEILNRRFHKMADNALLELEQLTRHPTELTGFQAKSRDWVEDKSLRVKENNKNHPDVIDVLPVNAMTRRDFVAYSASGLLGLLFLGSSVGWWNSNETVEELSSKVTELNGEVNNLIRITNSIQMAAQNVRENILEFQNIYSQTLYSLALLKETFERTGGLYNQIGQTGMNIAEIIEFVANLGNFYPPAQKYAQPVSALVDILKITPDNIFQVEQTLAYLNLWFSNGEYEDINNRVLSPVQQIFDAIDNELRAEIDSIQANSAELQTME